MSGGVHVNRAEQALQHATGVTQEWHEQNLASGGVCDFCSKPLVGENVATWATDGPIEVMTVIGVGEDHAAESMNYSAEWAACQECDGLLGHLVGSDHFVQGMAEWVFHSRYSPVGASLPEESREQFDREVMADLVKLYAALQERGLHRVTVTSVAVPKFPVRSDHGPKQGWKAAWEEQMALWKFTRTPLGQRLLRKWIDAECERQPTKKAVYEKLLSYEAAKLYSVPPVYVTSEICDVIEAATSTWQIEKLMREDLLLPAAFVYFDRPLYIHDRRGLEVNVQAISYAPLRSDDEEPGYGIALAFYSSNSQWVEEEGRDQAVGDMRAFREFAGAPTHLQILHLTPVWFGLTPSLEEYDVDLNQRTAAEEWWTLMQVTFRLMQQRIAEPSERVLDRHARKRATRAGHKERNVIVIHLRRPKGVGPEETSHGKVEWSHRWLVSGHWRNQWYPRLNAYRQVWIAGYVKGPDDAPLVVKPKAYEWDR